MRGTKGFPRADADAATKADASAADSAGAGSDARNGWFVLHGAAASAVAALLSYQLTVVLVAGGAVDARPSLNFAGLVVGLCAGLCSLLIGLLAWPVLNAQANRRARRRPPHPGAKARAIRWRGFSVLHIVAIGTAVPWIVLSLLLGSWQATTITIVVAAVAGTAGGFFAARRVWRPNRMRRVPPPVRAAGIGPALEHLPAAGADRRPLAFRSAGTSGTRPPNLPDEPGADSSISR